MKDVVLIYDTECPNVEAARSNLRKAFEAVGQIPRWREFDRDSAETPAEWRAFGSPTILVNGRDVAESEPVAAGNSCRVYRSPEGQLVGIPSIDELASALIVASSPGWRSSAVAVLPAMVALLPNVACPACWPAYAALLSSLGVGFLPTTPYLLPLTAAALVLPLTVLALRARRGQGISPLILGLVGALLLVLGRFAFDSRALFFSGALGLLAASLWNAWPKLMNLRRSSAGFCPACSLVQIDNQHKDVIHEYNQKES